MSYQYSEKQKIRFSETDMAGVVHFSNFFRMMEEAEHNFFKSLGLGSYIINKANKSGWPKVNASCDYKKSITFDDTVEIQLFVKRIGQSSISYIFVFNDENGDKIADGEITTVHIELDEDSGRFASAPIPDEIRSKISEAPESVIKS